MFVSIISQSTPLTNEPFALSHKMTAKSLQAISEIGGPRCCKRDSFLSILTVIDFVRSGSTLRWKRRRSYAITPRKTISASANAGHCTCGCGCLRGLRRADLQGNEEETQQKAVGSHRGLVDELAKGKEMKKIKRTNKAGTKNG